jgi:hypothetical protein
MAAAIVEITLPGLTGFSLTLDLYELGSDIAAASGIALTEAANRKGTYTGTTAAALEGIHLAIAKEGATVRAEGYVLMDDTAAVHRVVSQPWPGDIGAETVATAGGGAESGSGARTVSITVDDGANPLENATVRLSEGANTYLANTDAAGLAVFNVDDATYLVAVTKPGYSYSGGTLVVDDDELLSVSMDATSITPPPDPAFATLAIRVWGTDGNVAVGVDVQARVIDPPIGTGELFNDAIVTKTTGGDGYALFTIPKSCGLKYWIGESEKKIDNVGTDDVVYVDNWIGHE